MDASRPPLTCPRCGYDLAGAVDAWTDRCPVSGTCPECGTVSPWRDVFDPSRVEIRWLVEHARSWRALVFRSAPTLWRMALPWVFWSRVDVRTHTRPWALVRWVLLLLVFLRVLTAAPFGLSYGMLDGGYWPNFESARAYLDTASGLRLADQALNGLCWPVCTFSRLRPVWIDLYGGHDWLRLIRFQIGIGLTWALLLSALPVTRRMAKLRRAHILRALLLQVGVVVIVWESIRACIPVSLMIASQTLMISLAAVYLVSIAWSVLWWGSALRRGWRVRSWTLAALGTVAALLGGIVLTVIEGSVSYLLGG